MHRWLIMLLGLSWATTLLFCAKPQTLHLGVVEMPPYTSAQYLQDYGIFTEIVNAAGEEAGFVLMYDLIPAKRAEMTVAAGRLFGAFPFVKPTEEQDDFLFSQPVVSLKGALFYHKRYFGGDRNAKSLKAVQDLRMGGMLGGFYHDVMKQNEITPHNVSSEKLLLAMLEKQRIDLAPMDRTSGWNFIREYYPDKVAEYDTLPFEFATKPLHILVSKKYPDSVQLLNRIEQGLSAIKRSGKLDRILAKYGVDLRASKQLAGKKRKTCLALDGPLGDKGFNDMQYDGLLEAKNHFNIDIAFRSPPSSGDSEKKLFDFMNTLIKEEKCELLFSAGYRMLTPVRQLAKQYPQVMFAHLDSDGSGSNPSNLVTATFAQEEGSFVVGYLASLLSVRKKVGFIGGVDVPVIKAFENGFRQGVRYGAKEMGVAIRYVSKLPDYSGFSNPEKAKEIAEKLYENETDIIYAVAGESGLGVIEAAKEGRLYVIGVDSDQDYLAKGYVLTSMMKRVDVAVQDIVRRFTEGKLQGGAVLSYGLDNGGISLSAMNYTRDKIGEENLRAIKQIQQQIATGKLTIQPQ